MPPFNSCRRDADGLKSLKYYVVSPMEVYGNKYGFSTMVASSPACRRDPAFTWEVDNGLVLAGPMILASLGYAF